MHNEVSTSHDMNYEQIRYPTLVVELINFTKAENLFGTQKMVRPKKGCKWSKVIL